ncbi:MAG: hypothetical protein J6B53_15605 [Clostridia bacterium]|nr:hypothetical protein [Clostridia bacterium]
MCEALRDLMKDEIQEEIQKAVQATQQAAEQDAVKTKVAMINNLMVKQNLNAAEAMDILGIPPADQMKYTPWL